MWVCERTRFNPCVRKIPGRRYWLATHSSIAAWRIPWTDEPGGLQSMGSQRVRHDWTIFTFTSLCEFTNFPFKSISEILRGFKRYWGIFTKSEVFGIFTSRTDCNSGLPKVLPRTSSPGQGDSQWGSEQEHRVDKHFSHQLSSNCGGVIISWLCWCLSWTRSTWPLWMCATYPEDSENRERFWWGRRVGKD